MGAFNLYILLPSFKEKSIFQYDKFHDFNRELKTRIKNIFNEISCQINISFLILDDGENDLSILDELNFLEYIIFSPGIHQGKGKIIYDFSKTYFKNKPSDMVLLLDSDLQYELTDIVNLFRINLSNVISNENFIGYILRSKRSQKSKLYQSLVFNLVCNLAYGHSLADVNSGCKLFSRNQFVMFAELCKLDFFRGYLHLALFNEVNISAVIGRENIRVEGKSKYGFNRIFKALKEIIFYKKMYEI